MINGAVSAVEDHFAVSSESLGFAVASALLGAAAGAFTAGGIADKVGRLSVMKIAAVLFLISALGTGFANSLTMLIIFRIIGGLGVGFASVIAPAYIAEIAPAHIRGRLGSLQQLAIVTGIFVSLLVDYLLANAAGGSREELWGGLEAWRWMFLAMAVPAVIYGVLSLTIPESPRYLIATHKIPEARKVLTALLGEASRLGFECVYCATATSESLLVRQGWSLIEEVVHEGRVLHVFRSGLPSHAMLADGRHGGYQSPSPGQ